MSTIWKVQYTNTAKKQLDALDASTNRRIRSFLTERIAASENPRHSGKALKGSELQGLWRYRVGDYRILCEIQDEKLIILAGAIGHRREIYR